MLSLHAGNLSMTYENGSLRYISSGRDEILRMIYPAVRDRNWLTINPLTEAENLETFGKSFKITLRCLYKSGRINFRADYSIEGHDDSSLILTMHGESLDTFEKNRIGFCILHPVEGYTGKSCIILHPDGSSEHSDFPEEISPNQVFKDIRSLTWHMNKITCRIDFEGDVFETEDQRNWTDASFKTYSTPLSEPYPVTVQKGTRIFQQIKFRAEGPIPAITTPENKIIIKLLQEESYRIPAIGICRSSRPSPLTYNEIKILRALRFDHYRIDLHLYEDNWREKADQACNESLDLGYQVEFALFFDDRSEYQIKSIMDWFSGKRKTVSSVLLFHRQFPVTPASLARYVIPLLRDFDHEIRIVTGTNANFAQLNRNRPEETGNDSICYSIHPQEHASDNATLVENLAAQKYSVTSALRFSGNKGIFVSPITLQRRFNANTTFVELPQSGNGIPTQIDPRLMLLFGGCWTTGSLKYIFEAGAESITYYETAGERGLIQGETDSVWPGHFPSFKGMIFPVYHVFRFLLGNKNLKAIKSVSSMPLVADCLALTDGKQARIILANFTESVRTVKFDCCSGLFRIRTLNNDSYSLAASDYRWTGIENERTIKSLSDFTLDPYSINFIEGWVRH